MNKLKLLVSSLIAMLAFAIFAVTGIKVHAATVNDVYKADLTTITSSDKTVIATVVGGTKTMTFTASTNKTGVTGVSGTSLITEASRDYTAGAKLASSDTVTFTTEHAWSASILFAVSKTSSKVKGLSTSNGTVTNPTVSEANTLYTATISSGTAGNVSISRDGDKETWIFEIVVTESYDNSVSYKTVTFLDSDKTTSLGSKTVTAGETVTAIDVTAPMGKVFDKWLKVSDDKAFDFSTAINDDISLYASYEIDPNYVVGDGYTLNSALMGALYNEGYTSSFDAESTTLTNTNIAILYGTSIKEVDGTPKTYHLNTGGGGSNTKRGISITTTEAGTITFIADGNGSDRTVDISKIVGTSNTVQQSYTLNKNDSSTEYTFTVEAAGTYYLYGSGTINIYYASFEEAAVAVTPTVTAGTVTGVDSDNNTAVAFVAKIENVTDVTLLTNMSFHLVATHGVAKEADYAVTTCYTALTAFGDGNISGFDSSDNTYYVYFVVSGIEEKYDGLTLAVTFNASYDGVALTQTTFDTYTYTVSSQA